jgi:hypothetical protein
MILAIINGVDSCPSSLLPIPILSESYKFDSPGSGEVESDNEDGDGQEIAEEGPPDLSWLFHLREAEEG